MQGTIDIVALLRQGSALKQKAASPDINRSEAMSSFKKELAAVRSSRQSEYQNQVSDSRMQGMNKDNRAERLSKVMSNSKVNVEKLEDSGKTEGENQMRTQSTAEAEGEVTEKKVMEQAIEPENNAESEAEEEAAKLIESAEALIQQLMQIISSADESNASKANLENITAALEAVSQTLEQLTANTTDIKDLGLSAVLKDLKFEIKELKGQLEGGMVKDMPQLIQTVNALKHLIGKMNEIEPEAKRKLNETAIAPELADKTKELPAKESKTVSSIDTALSEAGQQTEDIKLTSDVRRDSEPSEGNDSNKDGKEAAAKSEKENSKTAVAADNSDLRKQADFAVPQTEKPAFEVNVKEVNLNAKKEAVHSVSKSDIINQVVKKADLILREGHSEMVMKLEPESLGKLNLKIVIEKGLVTAKFIAESQQVKEILESSFNQLKDVLHEKGIEVQNLSVSVGQQSKDSSSNQSFNQWKQTIKAKNRNIGGFMELDAETMLAQNPYSYHEGRIDFRA